EPLLDESLGRMHQRSRHLPLRSWVQKFGGARGLRRRVAAGLERHGVLRAEEAPFLLFFSRTAYRQVDPGVRKALVQRVLGAITSDADEVDARTVILVSLAKSTGVLKSALGAKTVRA